MLAGRTSPRYRHGAFWTVNYGTTELTSTVLQATAVAVSRQRC